MMSHSRTRIDLKNLSICHKSPFLYTAWLCSPVDCISLLRGRARFFCCLPDNHQGEQQDKQDIEQDEGGAAVLARHVGETPDVAQADSRSGCGEDDTDAALEVVMG